MNFGNKYFYFMLIIFVFLCEFAVVLTKKETQRIVPLTLTKQM